MLRQIIAQAPDFFSAGNLRFMAAAAGDTLLLTAAGCGVGVLLGFLLALLRTGRSPWLAPLRFFAILYVELFRRIPFIVVLFLVLFSIQAVAPAASLFAIATVAVCATATAFIAEIIRAGFESVERPQIEAAETLNLPRLFVVRAIILPQAWRVILPPSIAFVAMFLKDTALASQVGVVELTFVGKALVSRGYSSFLVFAVVTLIYVAISWPLTRLGRNLEARLGAARH